MKFQVTSTLQYSIKDLSTLILNISVLKSSSQTIFEENLHLEPFILAEELPSLDSTTRSVRIVSEGKKTLTIKYKALVEHEIKLIEKQQLSFPSVADLPSAVLPYLLPSRYCQSDKLLRLAQDKFGRIENAYDTVRAICIWIDKNVDYVSGSTDSETSAFDTVTQRQGVCRDFAHLGIALCRALTIPARYLSCYAYKLHPPDFHACFEAYMGGNWVVFDPTKLVPLNALVKIGTGKDAADVAVGTFYGNVNFKSMEVTNQVMDKDFRPLYFKDLENEGICL